MPSSNNRNPFKAGLFIVVSFALAAGIFFGITGSALLDGPTKAYRVVFDLDEDVGGLVVGSEVRLGGLAIGKVDAIDVVTVDPAGTTVVEVGFSTPARYAIKRDAVITVQSPLTGSPNLNITGLGIAALANDSDRLDGRTSGFAAAIDQINAVGVEARQTIAELRPQLTSLVGDVRPRVSATLDQIKSTAATAEQTIAQVRTKIEPAYEKYAAAAEGARSALASVDEILGGGKGDLTRTIADLAATMASVRERAPGILDRVAGAIDDARGTLAKTAGALDDVRSTLANTRELTGTARTILATNRTRIDDIIRSAKQTADNLGAASGEIRRSPWRLLYTPKENEVANQNLYDATRQLAEASRKLQDSAVALRDLSADPDADQATVQPMLDALNQDFANYQKVEATLWERVRK